MDISKSIICLYLLYFKDFEFVESRKHGKGVREKSSKKDGRKEKFFLNGQFSKDTGIVELQHNGHRGSICGELWTSQDARFVCRKILNNEQASAEKLKITNPMAYGYNGSAGFRRLGCLYKSLSLRDCNVTELPAGDTSASGCGNDSSLAAVCCKQDMEKGGYLCMREFSELLNNSIDTADCSDIHQTCFMAKKEYYIKLENSCICLDEDDAKRNITDNRCQDESTATEIEQNRSGLRGIQVYRLNISEDKSINSSKCIQVHVNNKERKFSVENCEMLRQVICLENICKSQSCQNSGICVPNSDYQGFTCKCIANYIGEKCEHDPCNPSRPCSNNPNTICKVNKNRTGHVCIPNGNASFTTTTQRPKTHGFSSNKDTNSEIIMIPVTLSVVAIVIALCVAFVLCRRKIRSTKGDPRRPNSLANQTYGIHVCQEKEVYDFIDESKLDSLISSPVSNRTTDEVITFDEYSTPSDALAVEHIAEYADTYDEAKLIKYRMEVSEENKAAKCNNGTAVENDYYILEKEDMSSKHEADGGARPDEMMKRVSSYEDTDNCVNKSFTSATRNKLNNRNNLETSSGYEQTCLTDRNFPKCPASRTLQTNNAFASGLDNIPESFLKSLGIRIVRSDYSEYYTYKMHRRRSASLCRCESIKLCNTPNKRSESNSRDTNVENVYMHLQNYKDGSKDVLDDYDKLCNFSRKDTTQIYRYDHFPGFMFKDSNVVKNNGSDSNKYHKRSKSV